MKRSSLLGAAAVPLLLLPAVPAAGAVPADGSATTASACDGYRDCRIASRADVDGDGRADQVGVVDRHQSSNEVIVRVLTAKGKRMSKRMTNVYWPLDTTWHGAAKMDGRNGYELVLGSSMGAHMMTFRVLTYRNGALATLPAPYGGYDWYIDSSYSFNHGVKRVINKGVVYMRMSGSTRRTSWRHNLTQSTYSWTNGSWRLRKTTRTSMVTNRQAYDIGGWFVPYLDRF